MRIITLAFFLVALNTYAQEAPEWYDYELDSIVSFSFPTDQVFEQDTILGDSEIYQLFTYKGLNTLLVQRIRLEEEDADENYSDLPYDLESLEEFYKNMVKGASKNVSYSLTKQELILDQGFHAYQAHFEEDEGNLVYKSRYYILNQYVYVMNYIGVDQINETERDHFFESFTIDDSKSITQYGGNSPAYRLGYHLGKLLPVLVIGIVVFIIVRLRSKKKQ